jgi:hypothetical protein
MSYRPEDEFVVDGFPTLQQAREYARRRTRDSPEELRGPGQTHDDLRRSWSIYGEDAMVLDDGYTGVSEIEFFVAHPATAEERDWQSIARRAGGGGRGRS